MSESIRQQIKLLATLFSDFKYGNTPIITAYDLDMLLGAVQSLQSYSRSAVCGESSFRRVEEKHGMGGVVIGRIATKQVVQCGCGNKEFLLTVASDQVMLYECSRCAKVYTRRELDTKFLSTP